MIVPSPDYPIESDAYAEVCRMLSQHSSASDWCALIQSEWLHRVSVAEREGVAPLLYWCFKVQGWPPNTPGEARERLTRSYYATSAHNTLLLAECDRIVAALQDDRITVLVLKGVALVNQLYPNIGLRPMGDIDLLVPVPEVDRAAHILERLGYERTIVQSERLNRLIGTQLGFTAKSGPDLRIEIHWSLVTGALDRRAPDLDWFWNQTELFATTAPLKTRSLVTLSPTAHLLYVAAHALLEHGLSGARLIWLYDVHLILSRWATQIAWEELLSRAAAFGWIHALTDALRETAARFGTTLPEEVRAMMIQDTSLSDRAVLTHELNKLKLAEHCQRLDGLGARARLWYVKAMIFPSRRYVRAHYGQAKRIWWPVLYVIRWATLLRLVTRR